MSTELMSRRSTYLSPDYLDTQPTSPSQLVVNVTHISEYGDVTIYGVTDLGQNAIEEITGNSTISGYTDWTFTTENTYASVSQIVVDSFVDGHIEIETP